MNPEPAHSHPTRSWHMNAQPLRAWLPARGNVLFTLLIVTGFFLAGKVGAVSLGAPLATSTSTTVIPYQGRLTNASGVPLSGLYSLTFKLYNAESGGSALWTETQPITVTNGLFNTLLGSTIPITQSIITGNSSLWLGIKVGTDAEMTPRAQLGSVPYAVQALTVPDEAITSAKLDAVDSFSYVDIQESTTSTSPVSLSTPDSVTISLTRPQWVNIYYGATCAANSAAYPAYIRLAIDGNGIGESLIEMWGGSSTTITGFYHVQLAAGSHTIETKYFTQSGGTAAYWRRKLLVFAISQ